MKRTERVRMRKREAVLACLAQGAPVSVACGAARLGTTTFYRWCNEDEGFDREVMDAQVELVTVVAGELLEQAKGRYVEEEKRVETEDGVRKEWRRRFVNGKVSACNALLKSVGAGAGAEAERLVESGERMSGASEAGAERWAGASPESERPGMAPMADVAAISEAVEAAEVAAISEAVEAAAEAGPSEEVATPDAAVTPDAGASEEVARSAAAITSDAGASEEVATLDAAAKVDAGDRAECDGAAKEGADLTQVSRGSLNTLDGADTVSRAVSVSGGGDSEGCDKASGKVDEMELAAEHQLLAEARESCTYGPNEVWPEYDDDELSAEELAQYEADEEAAMVEEVMCCTGLDEEAALKFFRLL